MQLCPDRGTGLEWGIQVFWDGWHFNGVIVLAFVVGAARESGFFLVCWKVLEHDAECVGGGGLCCCVCGDGDWESAGWVRSLLIPDLWQICGVSVFLKAFWW